MKHIKTFEEFVNSSNEDKKNEFIKSQVDRIIEKLDPRAKCKCGFTKDKDGFCDGSHALNFPGVIHP